MIGTVQILWHIFKRYRKHIGLLLLLGVMSAVLEGIGINAVIPLMSFFMGGNGTPTDFVTKSIYTLFMVLHVPFTFRYILGFVLSLFVVRALSVILFGYVRAWINADFLSKESADVMRRTLLASWPFTLRQKIGTMQNSLVRDVQQTSALLGAVVQVVQSVSGLMMYLLVAINISSLMTLYAVGGGFVLALFLRSFLSRMERLGHRAAGVEKQFAQFLTEHIIGMKSIKIAAVERPAIKQATEQIELLRHLSIRQQLVGTVSTSMFQPASIVLVVLLFFVTYHTPQFNIISFGASLYLIQKIFAYLESGQSALQSVSGLLPYAKNVIRFKQDLDTHREREVGTRPFVLKRELRCVNLSFSYDANTPILSDLTMTLRAGEAVGLIGPSGSGKTSVADIILRLFEPTAGSITLDGVQSTDIALHEWRSHIGYVSQDIFLLNGTIEENIRFYNQSITQADIERAAQQANIFDFVQSLPNGFKTVTGDRGVMLSGGQRQRIVLARALARKPALLILDEATSALDQESERLIHEAIRAIHGTMTVLIIAHRLSTVTNVDTLFVIEKGRLIEQGTPQQLLDDPKSYFHRMSVMNTRE